MSIYRIIYYNYIHESMDRNPCNIIEAYKDTCADLWRIIRVAVNRVQVSDLICFSIKTVQRSYLTFLYRKKFCNKLTLPFLYCAVRQPHSGNNSWLISLWWWSNIVYTLSQLDATKLERNVRREEKKVKMFLTEIWLKNLTLFTKKNLENCVIKFFSGIAEKSLCYVF